MIRHEIIDSDDFLSLSIQELAQRKQKLLTVIRRGDGFVGYIVVTEDLVEPVPVLRETTVVKGVPEEGGIVGPGGSGS